MFSFTDTLFQWILLACLLLVWGSTLFVPLKVKFSLLFDKDIFPHISPSVSFSSLHRRLAEGFTKLAH